VATRLLGEDLVICGMPDRSGLERPLHSSRSRLSKGWVIDGNRGFALITVAL